METTIPKVGQQVSPSLCTVVEQTEAVGFVSMPQVWPGALLLADFVLQNPDRFVPMTAVVYLIVLYLTDCQSYCMTQICVGHVAVYQLCN